MEGTTLSDFVLTLKVYANTYEQFNLQNIFEQCRSLYNYILRETLNRYNAMHQSKEYQKNKRYLKAVNKKVYALEEKIEKETNKRKKTALNKQYKTLKSEQKELYAQQKDIMMKYGYNEYVLHEVAKIPKYYFSHIDINTAQKLATRAFKTVEKLRTGKAKSVRFIRYNEMTSIEGKDNKSGILFRFENNKPVLKIQGMKIPVKIYKRDRYAQDILMNHKLKYTRIIRKNIRGRIKYYVQLVFGGTPPFKNRKLGMGKVGIDPSLQHMAISSDTLVTVKALVPKLNLITSQLRVEQRKLDRQRRANNPHKFKPDGTIDKSNKDKWVFSNNYLKTRNKVKELHRKQKGLRKYSHECLANEILKLGNVFHIEKNSFKAFQKKKKKTTKRKGRYQSKKRFGKSIGNKAPSMFLSILERKVNLLGGTLHYINPRIAKPSQYDHMLDDFVKKKLHQRRHMFINGDTVQRDCYSAFLIQNCNPKTHVISNSKCHKQFAKFKTLHDLEIESLKKEKISIL